METLLALMLLGLLYFFLPGPRRQWFRVEGKIKKRTRWSRGTPQTRRTRYERLIVERSQSKSLFQQLCSFLAVYLRQLPPVLVMPKKRTRQKQRELPILQRAQRQPPPPPKPLSQPVEPKPVVQEPPLPPQPLSKSEINPARQRFKDSQPTSPEMPILQRAQRQPPPPKPVAKAPPPPPKPVEPMPKPSTAQMFQAEIERRKQQQERRYLGPPSMSYQAREARWECVRMVGSEQKVDELYWKLQEIYPEMSPRAIYRKICNDERYLRGDRLG